MRAAIMAVLGLLARRGACLRGPARRGARRLSLPRAASAVSIYEARGDDAATYALAVPAALVARVPGGAATDAYLLDALALGLGVLERAAPAGEGHRVAREVDALVGRLGDWDATLRERLDASFAARDAATAAALDRYLGSRGVLAATMADLKADLGDPARATSVVSATATAVAAALTATTADVRSLLDAADATSSLGRVLATQSEAAAAGRAHAAAQHATLAAELRRSYDDLDAKLGRALDAVGAPDYRRADVKGRAFEADVADALRADAGVLGDGVEDVSLEAAAGSRSKKGDLLIRVGDAKIAVEVKAGRFAMAGAQSLEQTLRSAMATRGAGTRSTSYFNDRVSRDARRLPRADRSGPWILFGGWCRESPPP